MSGCGKSCKLLRTAAEARHRPFNFPGCLFSCLLKTVIYQNLGSTAALQVSRLWATEKLETQVDLMLLDAPRAAGFANKFVELQGPETCT